MPLSFLYISQFIVSGVLDSIGPLMPFIAAELGFSIGQVSFLRTELYIPKIIFLFGVLAIARKVKNKYLLWGSTFCIALGYLVTGFLGSFVQAVVLFALIGIALTFYGPLVVAEIAMIGRHGNRGRITSNFSTFGETGKLVFSTIVSTVAIYIGWRYSILGAGLIILPVILILIWRGRHFNAPEADQEFAAQDKVSNIFANKRVVAGALCSFFDNIASSSLNIFLPFLVLALTNNAAYIPITAGAMLLGTITGKVFMGRATDKKNPAYVFIFCELGMALMTLIIGITGNIFLIVVITFLLGIFTKGTVPVYQVMIAKASDADGKYKSSSALMVLTNNIGSLIAGWLFGFIAQYLGVQTVFIGFSIAAAVATLPGFYYNYLAGLPKPAELH